MAVITRLPNILHFLINIFCTDGTSAYGNIVITGRADADKAGFAINLFKAIHASDDIRQLKIAKTTAGILNKKGVAVSADKIKGTTMIIENAGALMSETIKELTEFMYGDTENMLVILTGEDYSIKKLFFDKVYIIVIMV